MSRVLCLLAMAVGGPVSPSFGQAEAAIDSMEVSVDVSGRWRLTGTFVPGGNHPLELTQVRTDLRGVLVINDRCGQPFGSSVWEERLQGNVDDMTVILYGIEIRQTVGTCRRGHGLHKFTGVVSKDRKRIEGTVILSDNREQRWTFLR
jgi:hypothetical protein